MEKKISSIAFYFGLNKTKKQKHKGTNVSYSFKHLFSQVAVGRNHVIVVTTEGVVYTWGDGQKGQLGHGHLESLVKPQVVEALKGKSIVK